MSHWLVRAQEREPPTLETWEMGNREKRCLLTSKMEELEQDNMPPAETVPWSDWFVRADGIENSSKASLEDQEQGNMRLEL